MTRIPSSTTVAFIMCCCALLFAFTTATHIIYPTAEHPVMYLTTTTPYYEETDGHSFGIGYSFSMISEKSSGKPTDLRCILYDAGYNSTILSQWVVTDFIEDSSGRRFPDFFTFPKDHSQLLGLRCALTFSVLPPAHDSTTTNFEKFSIEFQRSNPDLHIWTLIEEVKLMTYPSWNKQHLMNDIFRAPEKQYLVALTDNSVAPTQLHEEWLTKFIVSKDYKPLTWSFAIDNTQLAHAFLNETHISNNLNTLRIGTIGRGWFSAVNATESILPFHKQLTCYINNLPVVAQYSDSEHGTPSIWIKLDDKHQDADTTNLAVLLKAMFPSLMYTSNLSYRLAELDVSNLKPAHILTFDCGADFPLILPQNIDQSEDMWSHKEINFQSNTTTLPIPTHLADVVMSLEFGFIPYDAPTPSLKVWTLNQRFGQGIAHLSTNAKTPTLVESQTQFPLPIHPKSRSFAQPSSITFAANNATQYDQIQCTTAIAFYNLGIQPFLRKQDTVLLDDEETVYITIPKLNNNFILANGNFNNTYNEHAGLQPDQIVDQNALIRNTMVTMTLTFGDSKNDRTVATIMVAPTISETNNPWVQNDDFMQLEVHFSTAHFFPGKTPAEIQAIWDANSTARKDEIGIIIEVFIYGRFADKNIVKFNPQAFDTTQCIFEYHHGPHTTQRGSVSIFTSPLPVTYIHEHTIGKIAQQNNTQNVLELQYIGHSDNILLRTVNHHNSYSIGAVQGRWAAPSYVPVTDSFDMAYNDSPLGSAVVNGMTLIPATLGLPKHLSTFTYKHNQSSKWYAFEHIAAKKTWGNVKYPTIIDLNTIVLTADGRVVNDTMKEATLEYAPIIWKQSVSILKSSEDTPKSSDSFLEIPMMIAFERSIALNSPNSVSSTIGLKPPTKIPAQPGDDEDHPTPSGGDDDKKKPRSKAPIIALIIVILLVVIAGGLFFIYRRKTTQKAKKDSFLIDPLNDNQEYEAIV